mgnify:CR=1 FL=1
MYVEHLRYLSYEKVNETVTLSFASLSEDPDTLSCFGGDGVYFVVRYNRYKKCHAMYFKPMVHLFTPLH